MLTLDHLENRERVYEAMNECSRTEHYWILFRKYYPNAFDTWYGVMRYGDSFMHIAGSVEMTYKLGHMVVFEEWYQQNKAKHLVLS